MKIVPINEIPKQCEPFPENLVEVYKTFQEMEALCKEQNGIGLSAFQVGIPWPMFVATEPDGFHYYYDCDYTPIGEEKVFSVEGCLSLKDEHGSLLRYKVERFAKIRFFGKELIKTELKAIDREVDGLYSIVYQHEIDHQKSVLISEIGNEVNVC